MPDGASGATGDGHGASAATGDGHRASGATGDGHRTGGDGAGLTGGALTRPDRAPRETLLAIARTAAARAARVPSEPAAQLGPAGDLTLLATLAGRTRQNAPAVRAAVLREAAAGHLAVLGAGSATGHDQAVIAVGDAAERLLDDLVAVVSEHGLTLFAADADALLARRAVLAEDEEAALAAITRALARLDEQHVADGARSAREHRGNLLQSYRAVSSTLAVLGLHEVARPLLDRARVIAADDGDPLAVARCDHERVRVDVSWALRLTGAGREPTVPLSEAARQACALQAEPALLAEDHRALMRAVVTLARRPAGVPDAQGRVATLDEVVAGANADAAALGPHRVSPCLADHLVVRLARSRALDLAGRRDEAIASLREVRARRPRGQPSLMLALSRELVGLTAPSGAPSSGSAGGTDEVGARGALREYAADLEQELWTLQRARMLSLSTRLAHEQLRREHGEVTAQALTDPLTGLPNRRALDGVLADHLAGLAARGGGQLAIAMIDVDHFKTINDRLSHARGDDVLRLVAQDLRRCLRADDVVARYGGDEFVVVLPGSGGADARAALERAARAVARTPVGDGSRVSLSVGVAGAEHAGLTSGTLLARADRAMYAAKRTGGGAVVLDETADTPPGGLAVGGDPHP